MYEGKCYGGPIDGQIMISRFPKGILLVDKSANKCWIYEWNAADKCFKVRSEEAMEVYIYGDKNRYRAALEPNYDVIAAPGESK